MKSVTRITFDTVNTTAHEFNALSVLKERNKKLMGVLDIPGLYITCTDPMPENDGKFTLYRSKWTIKRVHNCFLTIDEVYSTVTKSKYVHYCNIKKWR